MMLPKNGIGGLPALGEKSRACLRIAASPAEERLPIYEGLCNRYGQKVVDSTLERLARRGYIDYGVCARTGWLTEKGDAVLGDG